MKKIHFFSLSLLLLAFLACETTVDIPLPPHEKRIVINGFLQAGQEVEVYISQSFGPTEDLDEEEVMLPDATVELLQDGVLISTLTYRDTSLEDFFGNSLTLGKFVSEGVIARVGDRYELRVSHPDYPTATAHAVTPPRARIIKGEFVREAARKISESGNVEVQSLLKITINDTAAFDSYYQLESLRFRSLDRSGRTQDTVFSQAISRGEAIRSPEGSYEVVSSFVSDTSFNGMEKTIDFLIRIPSAFVDGELVNDYEIFGFEGTISNTFEAYKNYFEKLTLQRENLGGISFFPSEPVIVDSNVENGYGIFVGLSRTKFRIDL